MRRPGSVGLGGTGSSALKSVQAMSAAALLRQCGTQHVLRAMADYREACASDVLKPSALTWLYKHVDQGRRRTGAGASGRSLVGGRANDGNWPYGYHVRK